MTEGMHMASMCRLPVHMRRCAYRDRWKLARREDSNAGNEKESIFEALDRISKSIPEEALRKIPTDGAINYRKYLYGD